MKRSIPNQTLLYVVLVIAAVIVLFPLYQAVVTSL
ncbi:MAG: carbohydrate ABC transporter permease, partial [Chloroflexi bacterium]|nr:carbohydrate ABC transporter permease [Chloroflexota bacterium]